MPVFFCRVSPWILILTRIFAPEWWKDGSKEQTTFISRRVLLFLWVLLLELGVENTDD